MIWGIGTMLLASWTIIRFPTKSQTNTSCWGKLAIQLTDALRVLAHREPVYAYDFEGTRYDVGDKLGFLKATVEYALRRPDLGEPFKNYLQNLFSDV